MPIDHSQWQGRHVLSNDHNSDLERDSAAHEFGASKLNRKDAEEAAYKAYRTKHHGEAIQHHLKGLRLALSNGFHEDAEKHATMYSMHMKSLGLREGSMPPSQDESIHTEKHFAGFKSHPADRLLVKPSRGEGDGE